MATVMRTGQVMGHVWPTVENKKNSLMTEESGRRAQDIDVKPKHRRDIFRFLLTLVRVVWADLMVGFAVIERQYSKLTMRPGKNTTAQAE